MEFLKDLQKDLRQWYARLQTRGKLILAAAVIAFLWLVFQLIWGIATRTPLVGGWVAIVLNTLAVALVTLIVVQFIVVRRMQKQYEANLREALTKGRRGGNRAEQIMGVRNRGSMRNRGGVNMAQAVSMITQVSVEDLDKQYRPKPLAKPTLIDDWQDISEPGLYALQSEPAAKVEIIDAADIGGGYFVGRYSTSGILKDRRIMTHRQTGEPLRFDTLRNAKKAVAGKSFSRSGRKRK